MPSFTGWGNTGRPPLHRFPRGLITDETPGQSAHNQTDENANPVATGFDFALYAPGSHSLDWKASDQQWQTAISIVRQLGLISGFCGKGLKITLTLSWEIGARHDCDSRCRRAAPDGTC